MKAGDVTRLLEANWPLLKAALGEQWEEFGRSYREIIAQLPTTPDAEAVHITVDRVVRLLAGFEDGRVLLREAGGPVRVRLLVPASHELDDVELVRQICNRLRVLAQDVEQPRPVSDSESSCDPIPPAR